MRSPVVPFALLLAMLSSGWTFAQQDIDPSGVWVRDDGNSRVRVAACGNDICATNLWIGDTSGGEEVGDRLVMSLKPDSGGKLTGTAYDAKRDRTYAMTMTVSKHRLVTRGCLLGGGFCKDVSWKPSN